MCGIAGILKYNKNYKLCADDITVLLKLLEFRGKDATGVSWMEDKVFQVLKAPLTATEFTDTNEYQKCLPEIVNSPLILFHTRQATHGSPESNLNNHPIYNKYGMIIHNGIVHINEKFPSNGETDTEQLMLCIQKYGWSTGLTKVSGMLSIAYIDFKNGDLYLYSELAPLCWYKNKNFMAFASEPYILSASLGLKRKSIGVPAKNTVFKVKKDSTLKFITKIERAPYVYKNYGTVTTGYQSDRIWDNYNYD